jgi:prolyl-tRNA synthetase
VRWSKAYIPTLRETPAEAELASHRFLLRGGYIRKLAAGVYTYLPLMQRVLLKVTQIVREEMNRAGAQEILMPVLQPAELWMQTGRWQTLGRELMRMKDRHERDMVLGGTHEEVVTFTLAGELRSYRQMPQNLFQIQVKFRDEIRPRFGLMRGREFYMKDAYSFDVDEAAHSVSYQKMTDAYFAAFKRMGLDARMVESDTGAMGGKRAHEFMVRVETEGGEAIILACDTCDYAANEEKATSGTSKPTLTGPTLAGGVPVLGESHPKGWATKLEKVATPNQRTVEEVTAFLNVTPERLIKTLLYIADGKPVAALVRGDRTLNEVKLKNALSAIVLEMAPPERIAEITGAPVGFAGPVGLDGVRIVADYEIAGIADGVTGGNEADMHYTGVQWGRDFEASTLADLRNAEPGEPCPKCGKGHLIKYAGIEVGNTFMLGTKYSEALGAKFLDESGAEKPCIMGSYGIGITRSAQAAVESGHDENGIIWPYSIAPYHVLVLPVNMAKPELVEAAENIYADLSSAGFEVLFDDRNERGGVKFKDADLIGVPIQLIVGERGLAQGEVEVKIRKTGERKNVAPAKLAETCRELAKALTPA